MDLDKQKEWAEQFKLPSLDKFFISAVTNQNKGNNAEAKGFDAEELNNLPSSVRQILNENGEVQIGDKLIWYHKGIKYAVPAGDEKALADLKANPKAGKIVGKYSLYKTKEENRQEKTSPPSQQNGSGNLNLTDISVFHFPVDPRQYEFIYTTWYGENTVKYVHELWSWSEWYDYPGYYHYGTTLYLRIKLERKKDFASGFVSWLTWRRVTFNFTTNIKLYNIYTPQQQYLVEIPFGDRFFLRTNQDYQTEDYWVDLQTYGGYQCYCGPWVDPVWRVNHLSGTIYQYTYLSAYNESFNLVGNPIW